MTTPKQSKEESSYEMVWRRSFKDKIANKANNSAPVEAIVRNVSCYLRNRFGIQDYSNLQFLDMGCSTGANLLWLARTVSGSVELTYHHRCDAPAA